MIHSEYILTMDEKKYYRQHLTLTKSKILYLKTWPFLWQVPTTFQESEIYKQNTLTMKSLSEVLLMIHLPYACQQIFIP